MNYLRYQKCENCPQSRKIQNRAPDQDHILLSVSASEFQSVGKYRLIFSLTWRTSLVCTANESSTFKVATSGMTPHSFTAAFCSSTCLLTGLCTSPSACTASFRLYSSYRAILSRCCCGISKQTTLTASLSLPSLHRHSTRASQLYLLRGKSIATRLFQICAARCPALPHPQVSRMTETVQLSCICDSHM